HGTLPPKDFKKWAVICEHIIRHYNEGWADGYHLNLQYWEIWNEPDLDPDDSPNKRTWGGTKAQFFDFYEVAAKHLKGAFPHLKIGGPALSGKVAWAEEFLCEMQKREVPLDFFSWHVYGTTPEKVLTKAETLKEYLVRYGYENAESILNEWNYVKGWREEFQETIMAIHGIRGAIFTMACICAAQNSSIDMLMYYDTRPSAFNGVFDFYSYDKLKGYYPLFWYGKFYDMEKEIPAENSLENIYSLCGVDASGKVLAVVTYYTPEDGKEAREITLDFGKEGRYEVYLLDEEHDATLAGVTDSATFTLKPCSAILLREI
ncbi:MAG: hypothetical protein IKC69_00185, partial [Clostridia bacterium]|nr:hypothetical protein [Clostridia bacterium]